MKPNINKIQRRLKKRKVLQHLILVMHVLIHLFLKGLQNSILNFFHLNLFHKGPPLKQPHNNKIQPHVKNRQVSQHRQ